MLPYALKRIVLLLPTLLLVSLLVFSISRMVPGDIVELMITEQSYADDVAALRAKLGLDKPILAQYGAYLKGFFQGDLGASLWSGRPVMQEIANRFPVTLELAILALIFTYLIGIPIGVIAAIRQDSTLDYLLRSSSIGFLSIPGFWIATLILVFGSIWFRWTPPLEYIPLTKDPLRNLAQFALPALIMALALSAGTMRMTRTMMLEVMRQDYIRTAWAKGLSIWKIVLHHALRNASIPILSIFGLQLAHLLGGAVIMERIFVLPGMGKFMLDAITWRDYPVIQGINLMVGSMVILINLMVDLLYGFLDPRIRYR
jgi:peptide/nickel transport system permease protein